MSSPDMWALHVYHTLDAPRLDEISVTAGIVGGAFIAVEAYFFATLLQRWREYCRTERTSDKSTGDTDD